MAMNYSKEYQRLHESNPKRFSGKLTDTQADHIAKLVKKVGAKTLLDYGSGKGYQYLRDHIHMKWGGILPVCYDPGVRQLWTKPQGLFDGVICTDVLEHIHERDIPEVLEDVFSYCRMGGFVYFHIATRTSKKKLSTGQSVHLTVRPVEWWSYLIDYHGTDNTTVEVTYDV